MLLWLEDRFTEFPRDRQFGIWLVRAESAGLDTSREHVAQRGIALRDSIEHRLDRLGDALPRALRGRRRTAITSAEPDRARQFFRQRIDLLFRILSVLDVSSCLGLIQFFVQLGEP